MSISLNEQMSIRYALPEDEINVLYPLSIKYNMHIYEIKLLYDKYKDDYGVKTH